MRTPVLGFQTADSLTSSELTLLWREVYANYPVPLPFTEDELARYVTMSGIDLSFSRIATLDNKAIGLCFVAHEEDEAWIGGFGVVSAHRRTGIGLALMRHQNQLLDEAGVRHTRLEVLLTNRARRLYANAGFIDRRRLYSFNSPAVGSAGDELVPLSLEELAALHKRLRCGASAPPWQKNLSAVLRAVERDHLTAVGWRGPNGISAYAVEQARSGLTHLVDVAAECTVSAEGIVAALASRSRGRRLSLGDEPSSSPIAKALKRFGAAPRAVRSEMVRMGRPAERPAAQDLRHPQYA